MTWDVMVIGAGAAGLLAAQRAARRGCRTLLLEKNRKPGVKILMSGGTRCNLTHATDVQGMLAAFGTQARFLRAAIHQLPPDQLVRYFEQAGVLTKVESTGKVFPVSNRALDVQQALWRDALAAGVDLQLGRAVSQLARSNGQWHLRAGDLSVSGRRLIVTTGGCSYPGCGTTGDAYAWMAELGHTVVAPRPALVPVTCNDGWIASLSGITLEDVVVRVVSQAVLDGLPSNADATQRISVCRKQARAERRGAMLLTHFGLSGPAVLDISREITLHADPCEVRLVCDLLPAWSVEELQSDWQRQAGHQGAKTVVRCLSELLPQRLAAALLVQGEMAAECKMAEWSRADRMTMLVLLKSLEIPVTGTRGFAKAEVTAGGVSLTEIDPQRMASRCADDLFIAGELLDVDGPIGGFNFQAAFSTGWLAAEAASA
jgi:predicted flavoprotein YhiN